MINELQLTKRNTLYKNISLSFCCKFERLMERHILREGTSSCPISSSWSQGVPTLAPPCKPNRHRRPNASDPLHIPGSTLDSKWTDCLNLTTWFSYHVVSFRLHTCSTGLPRCTTTPLFTNHIVTACQSTRGHQERTPNPCQQSLYNSRMECLRLLKQQISPSSWYQYCPIECLIVHTGPRSFQNKFKDSIELPQVVFLLLDRLPYQVKRTSSILLFYLYLSIKSMDTCISRVLREALV